MISYTHPHLFIPFRAVERGWREGHVPFEFETGENENMAFLGSINLEGARPVRLKFRRSFRVARYPGSPQSSRQSQKHGTVVVSPSAKLVDHVVEPFRTGEMKQVHPWLARTAFRIVAFPELRHMDAFESAGRATRPTGPADLSPGGIASLDFSFNPYSRDIEGLLFQRHYIVGGGSGGIQEKLLRAYNAVEWQVLVEFLSLARSLGCRKAVLNQALFYSYKKQESNLVLLPARIRRMNEAILKACRAAGVQAPALPSPGARAVHDIKIGL